MYKCKQPSTTLGAWYNVWASRGQAWAFCFLCTNQNRHFEAPIPFVPRLIIFNYYKHNIIQFFSVVSDYFLGATLSCTGSKDFKALYFVVCLMTSDNPSLIMFLWCLLDFIAECGYDIKMVQWSVQNVLFWKCRQIYNTW